VAVVLLDGGPAMYVEIMQPLQPHSRDGAVVLADNIDPEDEGPYASWVRGPARGFASSSIVMKQGTEYSVWLDTCAQRAYRDGSTQARTLATGHTRLGLRQVHSGRRRRRGTDVPAADSPDSLALQMRAG